MFLEKLQRRYLGSVLLSVWGGLVVGCTTSQEEALDPLSVATEALTELAPNQANANKFYAFDNIVNIRIEMSDADWLALKTQQPNPPGCVRLPVTSSGESSDRFTWFNTSKVQVSGSKYLTTAANFTKVQIRKKSYCGSLTTGANEKPSIKLKFDSDGTNQPVQTMGLQYLDLHNSKQDASYVRQTLGYWLFGKAGLPHSRANYATVQVVTPGGTENLVYVNVEPIRTSFIGNPDNGFTNRTVTQSGSADATVPGTLYEFEAGDDFDRGSLGFVGIEKVSGVRSTAKPDLTYAVQRLDTLGVAGFMPDVINVDQFAKFWAMEVLLKHWDGYTQNKNNTYIYNDVVATSGTQSAATVDFKFIPWGIDQILQAGGNYRITDSTAVSALARNDPNMYALFTSAVSNLRLNLFSRSMLDGAIKTRIDTLNSQLIGMGLDTTAAINEVRTQLKVARAAAIQLTGSGSAGFYLADRYSGEVLHAGSAAIPNSTNRYEVYRRAAQDTGSDRWVVDNTPVGLSIRSEGFGRNLEASSTLITPAGHPFLYTAASGAGEGNTAWYRELPEYVSQYDFHPAAAFRNATTGGYIHFSASSDLTPAGQPRAYQSDLNGATRLFMY